MPTTKKRVRPSRATGSKRGPKSKAEQVRLDTKAWCDAQLALEEKGEEISLRAVAVELGVSPETVRTHAGHIVAKARSDQEDLLAARVTTRGQRLVRVQEELERATRQIAELQAQLALVEANAAANGWAVDKLYAPISLRRIVETAGVSVDSRSTRKHRLAVSK